MEVVMEKMNEVTHLLERVSLLDPTLAEDLRQALTRRDRLFSEHDIPHISIEERAQLSGLLTALAEAPPRQIDADITQRLRELSERTVVFPGQLKAILDECAFASKATDFGMRTLDIAWRISRGEK
jgi:hypothetical protein